MVSLSQEVVLRRYASDLRQRLATQRGAGNMPLYRQQSGQILLVAMIAMTLLLGFAALAVDIGLLYLA
jgi:hypothetical protein